MKRYLLEYQLKPSIPVAHIYDKEPSAEYINALLQLLFPNDKIDRIAYHTGGAHEGQSWVRNSNLGGIRLEIVDFSLHYHNPDNQARKTEAEIGFQLANILGVKTQDYPKFLSFLVNSDGVGQWDSWASLEWSQFLEEMNDGLTSEEK